MSLQAKSGFISAAPEGIKPVNGKYSLPALGYAYNALEPFIDARTMEIHHTKHHQAYINKLNEAMEKEPSLKNMELEEILMNIQAQPESVRSVLRNHGGGHWNHSYFWTLLKTNTQMGPKFTKLVNNSFGSTEAFKKEFEKQAMRVFGSGWAWVLDQNGKLIIITTPNQDNPMMEMGVSPDQKGKPLLGIDIWEHAYYLKYQNKRADYVNAFWSVLNWDQVEQNINK
ncbi:MAG: superoxide dismutase [Bacteroidia bacterium]|nr:superoxide dismutase [Bacteroidia bacterium]